MTTPAPEDIEEMKAALMEHAGVSIDDAWTCAMSNPRWRAKAVFVLKAFLDLARHIKEVDFTERWAWRLCELATRYHIAYMELILALKQIALGIDPDV